MKHFKLTFLSLLLFLLPGRMSVCYGQVPTGNTWGKYNNAVYIKENATITLTGDVNIIGAIVVETGYTVTITSNKDYTIKNTGIAEPKNSSTVGRSRMFTVRGTLIIKGTDGATITLDGGANHTDTSNHRTINELIYTEDGGSLEFSYVNIKNAQEEGGHTNSNSIGGALYLNSTSGTAKLKYCNFENCHSASEGGAIFITNGHDGTTLENCSFKNCSATRNGGAIYISDSDEAVTLKNCTIENCSAGSNGGGFYINNCEKELTLEKCTLKTCKAVSLGGGILLLNKKAETIFKDCLIDKCEAQLGAAIMIGAQGTSTLPGTCAVRITDSAITECVSGGGSINNSGGAIRTYGNSVSNLYLTRVSMSGNHAKRNSKYETSSDVGNGGALFWNAHGSNEEESYCYIDGCTFENNKSDDNGGAIKSQGSIIFQGDPTIIQNNQAPNGGGMYIEGYHGGANVVSGASNITFELNDKLVVKDNEATSDNINPQGKGGGIHFIFGSGMDLNTGSSITVNMNGATIQENKANGLGGGIYIENSSLPEKQYTISINLNHGTLLSNEATDGGGIYVSKGDVTSEKVEGKYFSVKGNTASGNGGGVYILSGTLDMQNGNILNNETQGNGGGLYVYNKEENKKKVTFTGGIIEKNLAKYGGGVCVDGSIELTIGDVTISENKATNGGGVCLLNGANMSFGAGEIKNNNAQKSDGGASVTTAYQKKIDEVHGMGGGVYLSSNTNLSFSEITSLGLYGNLADTGADDIFANGESTSVQLPDVSKMKLSGYEAASNLNWMEDYLTNDASYNEGTYKKESAWESDKTNKRYRDAYNNMETPYEVEASTLTNYVSLALGYEIIYITLTKYGLKQGESAIFRLSRGSSNNFQLIMTGDGKESISKKVAVAVGEWTITETGWSWTYGVTEPTEKSITKSIEAEENRTFVFKNQKDESISTIRYDEAIKVNTMGNASGTTETGL
ncbi:MAG: hypothetical protein J6C87_10900 [Bacteroides sp.]|nr:hypothetical protein [Bacteroides sp.]